MELNRPENYIAEIRQILAAARQKAYAAVNTAMIEAYWLIGKRIVEEEQNGKERAEYGKEIIKSLSATLQAEFGKGFSLTNLKNIRKFYVMFPELPIGQSLSDQLPSTKSQTVSDFSQKQNWGSALSKLSWSHFERILRVENKQARTYYLKEATEQNWSVRTLDRNISTLYYQRLLSSQKKDLVQKEMAGNTSSFQQRSDEFIKTRQC